MTLYKKILGKIILNLDLSRATSLTTVKVMKLFWSRDVRDARYSNTGRQVKQLSLVENRLETAVLVRISGSLKSDHRHCSLTSRLSFQFPQFPARSREALYGQILISLKSYLAKWNLQSPHCSSTKYIVIFKILKFESKSRHCIYVFKISQDSFSRCSSFISALRKIV